jgi:hypothetical protein
VHSAGKDSHNIYIVCVRRSAMLEKANLEEEVDALKVPRTEI